MLDPFTALSLAGNVVQFVQFGYQLAAKAHDLYSSTSGASEENLEIETVTTRLLGTVHELGSHLNSGDWAASRDSVSRSSRRLLEIAEVCKMIAEDILSRLEPMKIREPATVWRSLRQALKIMWTKEELDALMKRLKAYISELDTAILVSLKCVSEAVAHQVQPPAHLLNLAQTKHRPREFPGVSGLLQIRRGGPTDR